jgi:hypothetical protein
MGGKPVCNGILRVWDGEYWFHGIGLLAVAEVMLLSA